jgi:hypothetical protein
MAGTVLRVMPKRTLDFTSVSSGPSNYEEIVVAQGIDISQWREVSLMVRTHANSIVASGQIDIFAYLEGRTSEDPGILFASTSPLGTVTIASGAVAPAYSIGSIGSNTGGMLKVVARGTRVTSFGTNALKADVSIDLSLKSA